MDELAVLFLGTGAADWARTYEATAQEAATGAVRGMSAILVNGHVLVDCGGTVPEALELFGVDAGAITDLLVTHTHGDHLDAAALSRLLAARGDSPPLRVWLERGALGRMPQVGGIDIRPLEAGQTVQVAGLSVTALAANHVVLPPEQPLHYLLEHRGHTVLYATDGAWLLKETWLRLRQVHLDGVIWDATNGTTQGDWRIFEHNSVDMIRVMLQTLRGEGIVTPATRLVLTHMARTLCAPHEQMCRQLEPEGLEPAHDGMSVTWSGTRSSEAESGGSTAGGSTLEVSG